MCSVTLLTPYRNENVEDTISRIYRKVRYEFNVAVKKKVFGYYCQEGYLGVRHSQAFIVIEKKRHICDTIMQYKYRKTY